MGRVPHRALKVMSSGWTGWTHSMSGRSRLLPTENRLIHSSNFSLCFAQHFLTQYPEVFQGCLGHCTKTKISLTLKHHAQPVFRPMRAIPFHGWQHMTSATLTWCLDWLAIIRNPKKKKQLSQQLESRRCQFLLPWFFPTFASHLQDAQARHILRKVFFFFVKGTWSARIQVSSFFSHRDSLHRNRRWSHSLWSTGSWIQRAFKNQSSSKYTKDILPYNGQKQLLVESYTGWRWMKISSATAAGALAVQRLAKSPPSSAIAMASRWWTVATHPHRFY